MKIPGYITSLVVLLTLLSLPVQSFSQSRSSRQSSTGIQKLEKDQEQPKSRKVKKAEAKAASDKDKKEQAYTKAKEQDIKHRVNLQTPETRKRMKESKKQADQNNAHYHQSLWNKIFGRKR